MRVNKTERPLKIIILAYNKECKVRDYPKRNFELLTKNITFHIMRRLQKTLTLRKAYNTNVPVRELSQITFALRWSEKCVVC